MPALAQLAQALSSAEFRESSQPGKPGGRLRRCGLPDKRKALVLPTQLRAGQTSHQKMLVLLVTRMPDSLLQRHYRLGWYPTGAVGAGMRVVSSVKPHSLSQGSISVAVATPL